MTLLERLREVRWLWRFKTCPACGEQAWVRLWTRAVALRRACYRQNYKPDTPNA